MLWTRRVCDFAFAYCLNIFTLQHSKKKLRVKTIEFWIETARECFNIGNFNSLMAIIAGLNMSPIGRLKKTVFNARCPVVCLFIYYILFVLYISFFIHILYSGTRYNSRRNSPSLNSTWTRRRISVATGRHWKRPNGGAQSLQISVKEWSYRSFRCSSKIFTSLTKDVGIGKFYMDAFFNTVTSIITYTRIKQSEWDMEVPFLYPF